MNDHIMPHDELQKLLSNSSLSANTVNSLKEADEKFSIGEFVSAEENLCVALESLPDDLQMLLAYGNLLLRLNRPQDATLEFVKIMILNKEFALGHLGIDALMLVTENYIAINDLETASQLFQRVIEIDANNETAIKKLSEIRKT
jgi:tetratricopeptide (TPR) repeat protein